MLRQLQLPLLLLLLLLLQSLMCRPSGIIFSIIAPSSTPTTIVCEQNLAHQIFGGIPR
jgi:hypothetical protein